MPISAFSAEESLLDKFDNLERQQMALLRNSDVPHELQRDIRRGGLIFNSGDVIEGEINNTNEKLKIEIGKRTRTFCIGGKKFTFLIGGMSQDYNTFSFRMLKFVHICYLESYDNFASLDDFYKYMQLEQKIKDLGKNEFYDPNLYYNNDGIAFRAHIVDASDCLHIFVNITKYLVNGQTPKNLKAAPGKANFEILK